MAAAQTYTIMSHYFQAANMEICRNYINEIVLLRIFEFVMALLNA
jgi:hypothetical protein